MNESLESEIVELLIKGSRPKLIATQLNITADSVSRIRRKFGLPKCKRGGDLVWNTESTRSILIKKEAGQSYSAIGKELGISRQRVQQIVASWCDPVRGACVKCGSQELIHRHHTSYVNNIIVNLCASCHGKETTRKEGLEDEIMRYVDGNSHVPFPLISSALDAYSDGCLRRVLKELGVSCLRSKVPYHLMDWELSDLELSEIWGYTAHRISWVRFRFGTRYGKKGPIKRQPEKMARQSAKFEYWKKYLLFLKNGENLT